MRLIDADAYKERNAEIIDCEIDHHKYQDTLRELIDDSPTIDAVPCWIPCEERFPEEYGEYLVTMNDGSVQECGYIPENNGDALTSGWNTCESTGFVFIDEWDVIAWMPLPEPYMGERRDDE